MFEDTKKSIFGGLGLTRAGIGYPDINTLEPLADALGIIGAAELVVGIVTIIRANNTDH